MAQDIKNSAVFPHNSLFIIHTSLSHNHLPQQSPNQDQQQAITHGDGPLLIVAGAGTGKTFVITQRIAWLIMANKANVHEVLALTFTEKAAAEMQERVDLALPYGYVDLWISTFHAFGDKILRRHALDIGLADDYQLLDQTQAWLLIRRNLSRFNLDYYRPLSNPTKFIHALLQHFSRCKDEGITPADYLKYVENIKLDRGDHEFVKKMELDDLEPSAQQELLKIEIMRLEELANAYHVYQRLLHENNCLDFADLINQTLRLFKERPQILHKYRQQFKYILVDEFQDTNFVQFELIKQLAGSQANLTVVGDDDQSIYRFRGSSIANIIEFKEHYRQAGQIVLKNNYRSAQAILDRSHEFIQQNSPGRLEDRYSISKKLIAQTPAAGRVEHLHFDQAENEARGVVNKILDIKDQDANANWSDFAILVRANDSTAIFSRLLAQAKIPHQLLALKGLYNKPIILDLINFLRVINDPQDDPAMFHVLNFAHWGAGAEDITKITHYAKQKCLPLIQVIKNAGLAPAIGQAAVNRLNSMVIYLEQANAAAKKKKTSELALDFLYESGYWAGLQALPENQLREQSTYLEQFFQKIKKYEDSVNNSGLNGFLEMLDMELESGEQGSLKPDPEDGPDLVKIMTVHSAKGLEFKYVFVVNLVDRRFPTDERQEKIEIPESLLKENKSDGDFHLQEERRIFYVAMTRAKLGLYLTSADDYGGARVKKLSRFLTELNFSKPENQPAAAARFTAVSPQSPVSFPAANIYLPAMFSFSALNTYEKCPYQFYLGKIAKIPCYGQANTVFGDVIHQTLKEFLEQTLAASRVGQPDLFAQQSASGQAATADVRLPLEQLLKIYQKNWRDDWYENQQNQQEYFERGRQMLKNFFAHYNTEPLNVKFIEQAFKIKLNKYTIAGRIDRIDHGDDGVEIIDYKTGRAKADKLTIDDKRQLILYQIAAKESLQLQPVKLIYYYLETGKQVSFTATAKQEIQLKDRLLNLIDSIQRTVFEPTPNPNICQYCAYKKICQHKKL